MVKQYLTEVGSLELSGQESEWHDSDGEDLLVVDVFGGPACRSGSTRDSSSSLLCFFFCQYIFYGRVVDI